MDSNYMTSAIGAEASSTQAAAAQRVYVGIDLSLNGTGVAVWDGTTVETYTVATREDDGTVDGFLSRCESLAAGIQNEVDFHSADRVVIEGLSLHSKSNKLDRIFASWWLVLERLTPLVDAPFAVVAPTQLKMYATGNGNANKETVLIETIRRNPNIQINNNNEADATVLCAMLARQLGVPFDEKPPAKHMRGLEKVKWEA